MLISPLLNIINILKILNNFLNNFFLSSQVYIFLDSAHQETEKVYQEVHKDKTGFHSDLSAIFDVEIIMKAIFVTSSANYCGF